MKVWWTLSQLDGAPSPCRTSFVTPLAQRSCQQPASYPLLPSPSFTIQNLQSPKRRRNGAMKVCSPRAGQSPGASSCPSPPPTKHLRAAWSRPSATTSTSCQHRLRVWNTFFKKRGNVLCVFSGWWNIWRCSSAHLSQSSLDQSRCSGAGSSFLELFSSN